MPVQVVEVFADVACPFTHVALHRFHAYRELRCRNEPVLRVRAWPLELVNGKALDGASLSPKVKALRAGVAPDLFAGFHEDRFPATTLPPMAAEASAYRHDLRLGESFSLAIRRALFEDGLDVSDEDVLADLCHAYGVPMPGETDRSAVLEDFADGKRRGVAGSPHFFTAGGSFFCPSLKIEHDEEGYRVSGNNVGFERFVAAAFD